MFALRGIAVSLTFFVLLYGLLSALVAIAWRPLKPLQVAQQSVAKLLFGLRVLPFVAAVILTLAFVVPSFRLLEPHSTDESMGAKPLVFGVCALLLIAFGGLRAIAALRATSQVVAGWLEGACPMDAGAQAETLRSGCEAPPLTVVGVGKPRVLISESTIAMLSRDELNIALKHELAHMESRDNLKKLIFRCCPFPGMAALERAWSRAAELAADDAAVSSLDDAVELAAVLVKLSRIVPVEPAPLCTTGLVTDFLSQRVERLLDWDEASKARRVHIRTWFVVPPSVATLLLATIAYGPVLAATHEITEWLVR